VLIFDTFNYAHKLITNLYIYCFVPPARHSIEHCTTSTKGKFFPELLVYYKSNQEINESSDHWSEEAQTISCSTRSGIRIDYENILRKAQKKLQTHNYLCVTLFSDSSYTSERFLRHMHVACDLTSTSRLHAVSRLRLTIDIQQSDSQHSTSLSRTTRNVLKIGCCCCKLDNEFIVWQKNESWNVNKMVGWNA